MAEIPGVQQPVIPVVPAAPAPAGVQLNPAPAPVPADLPVVDPGVLATPLVPEVPDMQQQPPGVAVVIAGQQMMVAPEIAVAVSGQATTIRRRRPASYSRRTTSRTFAMMLWNKEIVWSV